MVTNFTNSDDKFAFTCVPLDICNIIAEYAAPQKMLDWIKTIKINWRGLCLNPAVEAMQLLEKNQDKINWNWQLSANPAAIQLLEKNQDKINWEYLSGNSADIHLFEKNLNKINCLCLSTNPVAIELLEKNQDKIN